MPRNAIVDLAPSIWTELTDGDATSVSFQILSGGAPVRLAATSSGTPPTSTDAVFSYPVGSGETNQSIADLFLGVSGAVRLWAFAGQFSKVSISHA